MNEEDKVSPGEKKHSNRTIGFQSWKRLQQLIEFKQRVEASGRDETSEVNFPKEPS